MKMGVAAESDWMSLTGSPLPKQKSFFFFFNIFG